MELGASKNDYEIDDDKVDEHGDGVNWAGSVSSSVVHVVLSTLESCVRTIRSITVPRNNLQELLQQMTSKDRTNARAKIRVKRNGNGR